MKCGEIGLQDSAEARTRAANLLTIHKCLRCLYPKNPELLYGWVRMHNTNLDGRTPLAIMLDGDMERIVRILEQQRCRGDDFINLARKMHRCYCTFAM
ncbi:antitoxin Xre/MbcA/ParS toxin-binding domain-containing protein [Photobacterium pectinilyticum]|uniref:antitoxin Xre/MbcA/ParS toxin-binding domain-containing protein n=1 Tax=Photobacterium pectinilyticum TaxID=2906793 RepID=UPI0035A0CB4C